MKQTNAIVLWTLVIAASIAMTASVFADTVQLEALYRAPVETVVDHAGNTAFLPG